LSFVRTKSSDYVHVLTSEIGRVAGTTQQMLTLPGYILVGSVQVGVAFSISPAMTSAALLCGAMLFALMLPFNRKVQQSGQALRDSTNAMYSSITDFLAGMKVAKSYGLEETHLSIFQQNSTEIARQLVRFTRIISKSGMYFQIGTSLCVGAFLWGAVELAHLSTDRLLVLVFIFTRLLPRFRTMQNRYHQILHALPAFEAASRMQSQLEREQEPETPKDFAELSLQKALQLEKVSFKYDEAHKGCTVEEIDLAIPARCVTAILGPSGAGKSTLADLMMGLLVPDEGRILIDGQPLTGEHLHGWRRSVGYVPQENFLFHETIRVNLAWAQLEATEPEMLKALESAAALDFVMALPEGLDTVVGDRGVRLSGGERQRIALARALLRKPTLLLLDEATSSLDSHNEALIQDAVEKLHGDITVVIIAHRISTVSRADHVVLLDHGKIVEKGTWKDLVQSRDSRLRTLIEG
jgi:ATP-binding cassette subfamily C protein